MGKYDDILHDLCDDTTTDPLEERLRPYEASQIVLRIDACAQQFRASTNPTEGQCRTMLRRLPVRVTKHSQQRFNLRDAAAFLRTFSLQPRLLNWGVPVIVIAGIPLIAFGVGFYGISGGNTPAATTSVAESPLLAPQTPIDEQKYVTRVQTPTQHANQSQSNFVNFTSVLYDHDN